jgi:hypothetical protein
MLLPLALLLPLAATATTTTPTTTPTGPEDGTGGPEVHSITYLVTMCGHRPRATRAQLERMYFGGKTNDSLAAMFDACSFGVARFTREANRIVEVAVPCSGRTASGLVLSDPARGCDRSLYYAATEWGDGVATRLLGPLNVSRTNRRVTLMPGVCPNAAFAVVGCEKFSCGAWLSGGSVIDDVGAYVHEIGHTLGLTHAASPTNAYGDTSSPMGWCCGGTKCYSAPHLWQLGWALPLLELDASAMRVGVWRRVEVPALVTARRNVVIVRFSSSSAFFVSFRARVGYDAGLLEDWSDAIFVHAWAIDATRLPTVLLPPDTLPTVVARLRADGSALGVGGTLWPSTWVDPAGSGLTVVVSAQDSSAATVALCLGRGRGHGHGKQCR